MLAGGSYLMKKIGHPLQTFGDKNGSATYQLLGLCDKPSETRADPNQKAEYSHFHRLPSSESLSGTLFSHTMTTNEGGCPAMEHAESPMPTRIFGVPSCLIWVLLQTLISLPVSAQTRVSLQPFAQQVRQVETSLAYLGQPLAQGDQDAINRAVGNPDEATAISQIEQVLDKYVLAVVEINPESRVKVQPGPAKPELVEAGTRIFLVRVINKAGVTAKLRVESLNALPVFVPSDQSSEPSKKLSPADVRDRWMDITLYDKDPMSDQLSGLPLEYRVLEIYSRDKG